MRLICGLVRLDGTLADPEALDAMTGAMFPPGLAPRVGRRVEGAAAMAVLDFAPDTPKPDLPKGADGTWLAADVRLDRPAQLAADLNLAPDSGASDLVLAALASWGEDVPDKLDGDFALAAWDPRRQALTCARDIMGVRPLCYAYQPGKVLAFASLPRGLHGSGQARRDLDRLALGRKFVRPGLRVTSTGFAEIAWLAAGHSLTVTAQGLNVHRAWSPSAAKVGTWRGSRNEAATKLRELIEQAVSCRLPPRGPVAAHLSGGLDSSAITVIAARRLRADGRRLHVYSQLATPVQGVDLMDERAFVQAVLDQESDLVWTPVYLPPLDTEGVTDDDWAINGPMLAPEYQICADAHAAGAQLILSGAGGDEAATYNATGLYAALLRGGHWLSLGRELPRRARQDGRSLANAAFGLLATSFLPSWVMDLLAKLRGRRAAFELGAERLAFLRPPFRDHVLRSLPKQREQRNRARDRISMLTESYIINRADAWSILSARHGLAFTFPLKDRQVIDFILSLPLQYFLDGGFSRQPFRNAMAGILPESIRWRTTKLSPFPDAPMKLAAAKPQLLRQVEALRTRLDLQALFDLDAIADAIGQAPDLQAPSALATGGRPGPDVGSALQRGLAAYAALGLARYIARMT